MSVTKDGFYNIEGKMFEVVHGVEGDCLVLGDEDGGTRISGPKPWGGGHVTKTFVTQEKYGPIERLEAENAKLRELCGDLFDRLMDKDEHCGECRSQCEHDAWNFGDPKCVYAKRMRELGIGDWREELRVG